MANKKVRTNTGHDAGPDGKRRMPRAEVKSSAKSQRRLEDKKEIKKGIQSEASVVPQHRVPWFARGNKPDQIREPEQKWEPGATWAPGTSHSDILCPTCGEPWDKASPQGNDIQMGRTDNCPACPGITPQTPESSAISPVLPTESVTTGSIAAPIGFSQKKNKPVKKVIMGDTDEAKKKTTKENYNWSSNPGAIMIGDVCKNDKVIFRNGSDLAEGIAQYMTAPNNAAPAWVVVTKGKTHLVTSATIVDIVPALEVIASEDAFINKLNASLVAEVNGCVELFCSRCHRSRQFVTSESKSKVRCIVCALESPRPRNLAEGSSTKTWEPGEDFLAEDPMTLDPSTASRLAHVFTDFDPIKKIGYAACGYVGNQAAIRLAQSPTAVPCKQCNAKKHSVLKNEALDPATAAAMQNDVGPGTKSVGPSSRLKALTKATVNNQNAAAERQKSKGDMAKLRQDVKDIKDTQAEQG